MTELDLGSFPVRTKGHKFEDFSVGDVLVHHWGRTITAGDNAIFSTATCNWNPMHLNAEFARAHGHQDVVVNPMLVLCTVVGLSVEDLSEAGGPFLGVEDCTFHRPVHPGDTLTARSTVLSVRESESRAGVGIVTWRTEAHNQRAELVVDYQRTNLVAKRARS
ncbi:MAG TPA: MaoC family dehydratase [Acidimicrobiales bacterium]|nr:MaoC family dehydratase [Acidimicrobiales bacterium]